VIIFLPSDNEEKELVFYLNKKLNLINKHLYVSHFLIFLGYIDLLTTLRCKIIFFG